jgi:flagellar hook-length control protein FliK
LAASITAMHRNGQTSAMLRLDPPGLGTLSVHIALGADQGSGGGQVNLLLLPAIAQTGQILNGGIDGLRQALAAAGLTLGQAQIGHGGGQNGAPDHEGGQARLATRMPAAGMSGADEIARPGVRAYA